MSHKEYVDGEEVKEPIVNPCTYGLAWHGPCGAESLEDDRCVDHKDEVCKSCGDKATHQCGMTLTLAVCGYPLCDDCTDTGSGGHRRKYYH